MLAGFIKKGHNEEKLVVHLHGFSSIFILPMHDLLITHVKLEKATQKALCSIPSKSYAFEEESS